MYIYIVKDFWGLEKSYGHMGTRAGLTVPGSYLRGIEPVTFVLTEP